MRSFFSHLFRVLSLVSCSLVLVVPQRSFAIFGIGDITFTTITADIPRVAQWATQTLQIAEQIDHAIEQVKKAQALVDQGKEIMAIAGDPKLLVDDILSDGSSVWAPLDELLNSTNVREGAKLFNATDALIKDLSLLSKDPIGESIRFRETKYDRSKNVYTIFATQAGLEEVYLKAVDDAAEIVRKEAKIQEKIVEEMNSGKLTENEIRIRQFALIASQGRVDVAESKARRAYDELSRFNRRARWEQSKIDAAGNESIRIIRKDTMNRAREAAKAGIQYSR